MTADRSVSVAMAAYNADRFVERAVAGILEQNYPVSEIVICDDFSTDGTTGVLAELSARDPRIRVLRNEVNRGGYATMNRAMSETRGDFVALYHADDVYDAGIVGTQVAFLERHPRAGAVFCLDRFLDEEGREYTRLKVPREIAGRELFDARTLVNGILRHKNRFLVTPSVMFRREAFEGEGRFDHARFGIAADLDLWLRMSLSWDIGLVPEHLMGYRHFPQQWSRVYERLRTEPEMFFAVMDHHLGRPGVSDMIEPEALACYAVHAARDNVERASNLLQIGDPRGAVALLNQVRVGSLLRNPLPAETLRILGLRMLVRAAARAGGGPGWRRLLFAARYRRWPPRDFERKASTATHTLGEPMEPSADGSERHAPGGP